MKNFFKKKQNKTYFLSFQLMFFKRNIFAGDNCFFFFQQIFKNCFLIIKTFSVAFTCSFCKLFKKSSKKKKKQFLSRKNVINKMLLTCLLDN